MPITPGETLGTYRIVRRIGAGATAEVFEVEHTVLATRHALKVLHPQWVEDEGIRARFLQEGKLQARFRHPGLVRVTDTLAEPGIAGLVMDLLEGETVRDVLDREGRLAPQEAVARVREALEALEEAHEHGVIHRDLKPENLFVERTATGTRLRIIDFGIAKLPGSARTQAGGTLGTVAYMSPEQVEDPSRVDARTDLFALGAVLWELLAGRPAFEGKSAFESMQRVVEHDPGRAGDAVGGLPGWLDDVLEVALRKDPSHRFPTAAAFRQALEAGARGFEAPSAAPTAPPRRSGSGPPLGTLFGIALLLGVPLLLGVAMIAGTLALGIWFRPSNIRSVSATSDPCGQTTIFVDGHIRNEPVEILVDGAVVHTTPVLDGSQTIQHVEPLEIGKTVQITAHTPGTSEHTSHLVSGVPPGVSLQLPTARREGAVGRTLVKFEGSCLGPGITYEARIDRTVTSGAIPNPPELWLDTTALTEGPHVVEVTVLDGAQTVATETASLTVGPKPPPGDLDQDGHLSKAAGGGDCDDNDPRVNPDAEELPTPNGVDDNCDGRVDEGTVAYDDDGDGVSEDQGDCDDNDRGIHPNASEIPDCRDQDCDSVVDEGVTLVRRDDSFEPNDSRGAAFDLQTRGKRAFSQELQLVSASVGDEAWFEFYSQDGDFDDWGIDVRVSQMPANSTYTLEIFDDSGTSRGRVRVTDTVEELRVRGKWLRDDSGTYTLRVRPERLHDDWCPVQVQVVAR